MHMFLLIGIVPFAILAVVLGTVALLLAVTTLLAFPFLPLLAVAGWLAVRYWPRHEDSGVPCGQS